MNRSKWAALALGAPGCLLAAVSLIVPTLAAFAQNPVWPHEPYNLGEAAGVRDEAEVIRLIEQGHDPNASYVIRPSLMFSHPMRLTPLEVAVARDDPAILRQLLAKGATMDAALWTRLRCMEVSPSVSEVLDEYRPDAAPSGCDGVNLTSHP